MADIKKIKRSEFATYLDVTPGDTATYKLLGVGITSYAISYNPQITTEKWIIHDNATSTHDSNQKQSEVSQKMYKGDECFEFVESLRDKTGGDTQTKVLDIDLYKGTGEGSEAVYPAKLSDCIVAVTSYGGEDAVIEYTLYYNGDAVDGTVTIADGVPTFTPTV